MSGPGFDPCSPIPLADDFLAGRPTVHRTAAKQAAHAHGTGHSSVKPHRHVGFADAPPVRSLHYVIPPNASCGAAKWIAGGFGAAGLGGGVIAGREIVRASAGTMAQPRFAPAGLPSAPARFNGQPGDQPGFPGQPSAIAPVIIAGTPPAPNPADMPEPSASLLFALGCLIAAFLCRIRRVRKNA